MNIPTTYLSLHDVTGLKAAAINSLDSPLMLTIECENNTTMVSLYFRDLDPLKIEHLAGSINAVLRAPDPPKVACPQEEAAYNAADTYMASLIRDLIRDLNRDPIDRGPASQTATYAPGASRPIGE